MCVYKLPGLTQSFVSRAHVLHIVSCSYCLRLIITKCLNNPLRKNTYLFIPIARSSTNLDCGDLRERILGSNFDLIGSSQYIHVQRRSDTRTTFSKYMLITSLFVQQCMIFVIYNSRN